MKHRVALFLAAMTGAMGIGVSCPAMAQPGAAHGRSDPRASDIVRETLLPPRVDYVRVRATLLHWGMSAADVYRVMGTPDQVKANADANSDVRVLTYRAGPIATTVSLLDDRLTGVALDIAAIDESALPAFSRPVSLGMSRATVLRMLGMPAEDLFRTSFAMTLEQMIFKPAGKLDVSVFLIDGRVVNERGGRAIPPDIFAFSLPLPAAPGGAVETIGEASALRAGPVAVGIREGEVETLYGERKLHVRSTFKGHPVDYAIYETGPDGSFARFTFIDGVVTEFADGGRVPLSQVLDGE
jgi:hypothetical protein